ncbi:MAG: hypothetical protein V7636_620, partial [Actinomycetota bacterium]
MSGDSLAKKFREQSASALVDVVDDRSHLVDALGWRVSELPVEVAL